MLNPLLIAIIVIIIIIAIFFVMKCGMLLTIRQIERKYDTEICAFMGSAVRIIGEYQMVCMKSLGGMDKNLTIAEFFLAAYMYIVSKQFTRDIVYYYRTSANHDIDMKNIMYGLIVSMLMERDPKSNCDVQKMLEIAFEMAPKSKPGNHKK